MPIYRQKFTPVARDLPTWMVRKQTPSECYRQQFPLDLARHITSHRAQGQTLGDCTVSVDLGLDNYDNNMPGDIASIIYVACTRVRRLQDLFVSPILHTFWEKIGSSVTLERSTVEMALQEAAKQFAANRGMYKEMKEELDRKTIYDDVEDEWQQLQGQTTEPVSSRQALLENLQAVPDDDLFTVTDTGNQFPICMRAVLSERHIGLDQGTRNFAIVVVDQHVGRPPKLVAADLYDLQLPDRFAASDVLISLFEKTDLRVLMQQCIIRRLPRVDRVIVHIEQMSTKNRNTTGNNSDRLWAMGMLLQKSVKDVQTCIVNLSQPHIHRQSGPMFKMGELIVDRLKLVPASYGKKRGRPTHKAPKPCTSAARASLVSVVSIKDPSIAKFSRVQIGEDVDLSSESDSSISDADLLEDASDYKKKKHMSASIFRYFVEADTAAQENLGINVDPDLQTYYREKLDDDKRFKLDDLGDALLHALNEPLCGGTNYKQLIPANSSLQCNRTVVVSVQPDMTHWVALHVTWNKFELLDFGSYRSSLENVTYQLPSTVALIKSSLVEKVGTTLISMAAVTDDDGQELIPCVDHIKIVVKQLKNYKEFTGNQAGALTQSTVSALKQLCTESVGNPHQLTQHNDKIFGALYIETNLATGQKYQVVRSAGKQTNARLAFPNWLQENANAFFDEKLYSMGDDSKIQLFTALEKLARSTESRFEMLDLSKRAKEKFVLTGQTTDDRSKKILIDVLLIGISKNEKHVKSLAASFRNGGKRMTSTFCTAKADAERREEKVATALSHDGGVYKKPPGQHSTDMQCSSIGVDDSPLLLDADDTAGVLGTITHVVMNRNSQHFFNY